jgi:hypothetical protein
VESPNEPERRFTDDRIARLWENAQDRETGADAIAAMRARQQLEAEKRGGGWHRFSRRD